MLALIIAFLLNVGIITNEADYNNQLVQEHKTLLIQNSIVDDDIYVE